MRSFHVKVAGYSVVVSVEVTPDGQWHGQFRLPAGTWATTFMIPSCDLETESGESAKVVVDQTRNGMAHFIGSTDIPTSMR